MRKKIYFQNSVIWQLFTFVFFAAGVVAAIWVIDFFAPSVQSGFQTYLAKSFFEKILGAFGGILFVSVPCMCFYTFIRIEHNNIYLRKDDVYIPDDWMGKRDKIQYKTSTQYTEISDIEVVCDNRNSKKGRTRSPMTKTYLVLHTKSGKQNRYFVLYFSVRSIERIINDIRARMLFYGNNTEMKSTKEIMETFFAEAKRLRVFL